VIGIRDVEQWVEGPAIITRCRSRNPIVADTDDMREAIHRFEFMRDIDAMLRRSRQTDFRNAVPGQAYVVNSGSSAVALSAATAKTVIYINSGSTIVASLCEVCIGFDGVTASAVPALVEICLGTKATNSTPGTNSTSFTPLQIRGWEVKAATCTAANTCTSEPTVLTSTKQWLVTPNGGLLVVQFPLGREITTLTTASTSGLQVAVRCNAPATVNVRGYTEHEE
jgi:hypothetical protein